MQHYWRAISNEFVNRYAKDYPFYYTTVRYYPEDEGSESSQSLERRNYPFSEDGNLYLTQREADCIYYLVQGLTIKSTAHELLLSPRTVEFYLKRIKEKFDIRSKKHLLEHLKSSNFFPTYFQIMKNEFEN